MQMIPDYYSQEMKNLVCTVLAKNPEDRPRFVFTICNFKIPGFNHLTQNKEQTVFST